MSKILLSIQLSASILYCFSDLLAKLFLKYSLSASHLIQLPIFMSYRLHPCVIVIKGIMTPTQRALLIAPLLILPSKLLDIKPLNVIYLKTKSREVHRSWTQRKYVYAVLRIAISVIIYFNSLLPSQLFHTPTLFNVWCLHQDTL